MKSNILIIVGFFLVVVSAVFTYFYFFGGVKEGEVADFAFDNKEVVISEGGIDPREMRIQRKNSVIFVNNTDRTVNLGSEEDEAVFELGSIEPGAEYHTNLLNETGEYTYFVEELGEEGRIVVYE